MKYKLLLIVTKIDSGVHTNVIEFDTFDEAELAHARISQECKSFSHMTLVGVKMYEPPCVQTLPIENWVSEIVNAN